MLRTAFVLAIAASIVVACKKDKDATIYTNPSIALTASQNVPASTGTGTGNLDASYNTKTRLMNYTLTWSGLSFPADSIRAIHIHALAGPGAIAISAPNGSFPTVSGYQGVVQSLTIPRNAASGSLTGSLFADGVVVKEEDLLAGQYYIDIHTKSFPNGQLRGQITFNK